METEIIGILLGIDTYDKIIIHVLNPNNILQYTINKTIKYPIIYTSDGLNCKICIHKHKDYYLDFTKNNLNKQVKITIMFKYYNFDNKKGISFLLKYMELI
jgi:hypothetical protein